jgi:diguanylate cyclase (GGDEF)-like protein
VRSLRWTTGDGAERAFQGRANRLLDGSGLAEGWAGTLQIQAGRDAPPAGVDPLTGAGTLSRFRDELRRALARARRRGEITAVLLLDLDRFGRINERHGHEAGDRILRRVADRLTRSVREQDAIARVDGVADAGGPVSRMGGDKFLVRLEEVTSTRAAAAIAGRILGALEEPFDVDGIAVTLTARAGISLFPLDAEDASQALRHAEAAIQDAPGASIRFYSRAAAARHERESQLEEGLRAAVRDDGFDLHYQPKVRHPDGRPVGLEALLRFTHPDQGPVPAAEAIELAERSGFIEKLGAAIFRRVCRDAARLHRETGCDARIFTNFSPRQMETPEWRREVAAILDETGVDPRRVGIEITESLFLQNRASLVRALKGLALRGVEISLDDFGTGYSSLGYLTRLPLHELKIDRSFVRGLSAEGPGSREIAGLIIILGRTLELRVVAEGVETEEQLEVLQAMGCRTVQGFYYARPQPLEDLMESLASGSIRPAGGSPLRS